MSYLGTKPANQITDSTLIADGTITPADLSTGKPVWDTSGNVGIGTNSPIQKLDVRGAIAATDGGTQVTFISNAGEIELARTDGDAYIDFKTSIAEDADCRIQQLSNGLRFMTGGSGSIVERMRIDNTGQQFSVIPNGSTLYPEYKCRAWVHFDGTGSITIRGSGNVSSITDIGVGLYSVNFATALPDGNYSAFAQADTSGNNTIARPHPQLAYNSGFYYIVVQNTANSVIDSNFVFSAVFR